MQSSGSQVRPLANSSCGLCYMRRINCPRRERRGSDRKLSSPHGRHCTTSPRHPRSLRHPGAGCLLTDKHDCRTASCTTTAEFMRPRIAQGRATPVGGSIYRPRLSPLGHWKRWCCEACHGASGDGAGRAGSPGATAYFCRAGRPRVPGSLLPYLHLPCLECPASRHMDGRPSRCRRPRGTFASE